MGRNTYEAFTRVWPARTDPWAERVNAIRKYIFSLTLDNAEWTNSTVVRGDVKHKLLDALNLGVIPLVVGHGKLFFREGKDAKFRLNEAKSFSKGIVKLSYEPQYG